MPDFVPETSVPTRTSNFVVESTSEDEKPSYGPSLTIESMSEEEMTPQSGRVSEFVIESMSEEETPLSNRASKLVIESMSEPELSQASRTLENIVEISTDEEMPQTNRDAALVVESTNERETLLPTRLKFDNDGSQNVQVEIHAPPSVIKKSVCAVEKTSLRDNSPNLSLSEKESVSFAALQPLENTASMYQPDVQHESYLKDSFREEFSIDTCEKETVLEQCSEEDRSTNSDDDSDIEILVESLPAKPATEEDENHDADTEVNENLSERSYDSDYSDLHKSVRTDSEIDDEEVQEIEDEASSIEEGVSIKEDDDVEEEEEEEGEEEEEEEGEEEGDDEDDLREEESEVGIPEVHNLSDEEADDEEEREEDKEYDVQDTDIDYDSLKKIMSTVNAAESSKMKLSTTELQSTHPSSSFLCNETTVSEYEVVDVDLSTTMAEQAISEGSVLAEQVQVTSDASVVEVVNQSLDTSVEMLSVSCVDEEKTANKPEMVFYFGENSTTSISEKLLGNESMNESQSNVTENVVEISLNTDEEKLKWIKRKS
jgi:hypothetical protein